MTNREAFIEYLQKQFDAIKNLSDEWLASCATLHCHQALWVFAFLKGKKWEYPKDGYPMPPGQHEEIVKWLKEEAKEDF